MEKSNNEGAVLLDMLKEYDDIMKKQGITAEMMLEAYAQGSREAFRDTPAEDALRAELKKFTRKKAEEKSKQWFICDHLHNCSHTGCGHDRIHRHDDNYCCDTPVDCYWISETKICIPIS